MKMNWNRRHSGPESLTTKEENAASLGTGRGDAAAIAPMGRGILRLD